MAELLHAVYRHTRPHRRTPAASRAIPGPSQKKGEGDHVSISPERDTSPQGPAGVPRPRSEMSWRNAPRIGVIPQVVAWILVGSVLLVCLGMLVGASWTSQVMQPKLRQQAEERRQINEEWRALRAARAARESCPRCANPLPAQDWYPVSTLVEDPPEDDD